MQSEDDIAIGLKLRHKLKRGSREPKYNVWHIAWSPDGEILASCSLDGKIRLWSVLTGKLLRTVEHIHTTYLGWGPDGILSSCSKDKTIRFWNPQTGKSLRIIGTFGNTQPIQSIAWSSDGGNIAYCSDYQTIRIWNPQTGQVLNAFTGHTQPIYHVAWSPDDKTLASCSGDGTIRLWRFQNGGTPHILEGITTIVYHVAWSPDGRILVSCSGDRTIRLWDTQTGELLRILEQDKIWSSVCTSFSYDGLFLAAKLGIGPGGGSIHIWRTDTWEHVTSIEEYSFLYCPPVLAFHPKAPVLATLDRDARCIRVWDLDTATLLARHL